jgi:4-hydroxy-tetrahydrodipicolinate synthase
LEVDIQTLTRRVSKTQMTKSDIKGIIVPMITPFKGPKAGSVDTSKAKKLTEYLVSNGVHGLMPLGTSGEFALMDREERRDLIAAVSSAAGGKVPVIAGVSFPSSPRTVLYAEDAEKAGADVVISTGPYYYKTNDDGLYEHFQMLIDGTDLPIMIYNIPSYAGYNIPAKIVRRLVDKNPGRVLGVKFTTNDLGEFLEYLRLLKEDISIMIGSDPLIFAALEMGAAGAVVGSANVLPDVTSRIYDLYAAGDSRGAKEEQDRLDPFTQTMILGTYPAALKSALRMIGLDCGPVRPPLQELEKKQVELVRRSIAWKVGKKR